MKVPAGLQSLNPLPGTLDRKLLRLKYIPTKAGQLKPGAGVVIPESWARIH